jgi:hypothetical protein
MSRVGTPEQNPSTFDTLFRQNTVLAPKQFVDFLLSLPAESPIPNAPPNPLVGLAAKGQTAFNDILRSNFPSYMKIDDEHKALSAEHPWQDTLAGLVAPEAPSAKGKGIAALPAALSLAAYGAKSRLQGALKNISRTKPMNEAISDLLRQLKPAIRVDDPAARIATKLNRNEGGFVAEASSYPGVRYQSHPEIRREKLKPHGDWDDSRNVVPGYEYTDSLGNKEFNSRADVYNLGLPSESFDMSSASSAPQNVSVLRAAKANLERQGNLSQQDLGELNILNLRLKTNSDMRDALEMYRIRNKGAKIYVSEEALGNKASYVKTSDGAYLVGTTHADAAEAHFFGPAWVADNFAEEGYVMPLEDGKVAFIPR